MSCIACVTSITPANCATPTTINQMLELVPARNSNDHKAVRITATIAPTPMETKPPRTPMRIKSLWVTLKIAGPPIDAQSGHLEPTGAYTIQRGQIGSEHCAQRRLVSTPESRGHSVMLSSTSVAFWLISMLRTMWFRQVGCEPKDHVMRYHDRTPFGSKSISQVSTLHNLTTIL